MMDFGSQFVRLLDEYRKPDGSPWQLKEIEQATNGFVKGGYLTNLRKGRIRQPGWDRMKAIAHVMGFPVQLWFEEPDQWDRLTASDFETGQEGSLKARLNLLFDAVRNQRTGRPFTCKEVADLSFGRLTEEQIERTRAGEIDDFKGAQYLALSEVFGVDVSYWYDSPGRQPTLDHDTIEALRDERNHLILNKVRDRSAQEKDILLNLLDQLDLLRAASGAEAAPGSVPAETQGLADRPRQA